MSEIDSGPFPKGALVAIGGLLAVTLAGTAAVRLHRAANPAAAPAPPPAVAAVDLRFADQADGSVRVSDGRTGALVARLAPDTNGFVRGVMRGMARDRLSRHIGQAPPFRLSRDARGKLWLQDTATSRLIDLEAFGEGNRAAFAAFLPGSRGAPTPLLALETRT